MTGILHEIADITDVQQATNVSTKFWSLLGANERFDPRAGVKKRSNGLANVRGLLVALQQPTYMFTVQALRTMTPPGTLISVIIPDRCKPYSDHMFRTGGGQLLRGGFNSHANSTHGAHKKATAAADVSFRLYTMLTKIHESDTFPFAIYVDIEDVMAHVIVQVPDVNLDDRSYMAVIKYRDRRGDNSCFGHQPDVCSKADTKSCFTDVAFMLIRSKDHAATIWKAANTWYNSFVIRKTGTTLASYLKHDRQGAKSISMHFNCAVLQRKDVSRATKNTNEECPYRFTLAVTTELQSIFNARGNEIKCFDGTGPSLVNNPPPPPGSSAPVFTTNTSAPASTPAAPATSKSTISDDDWWPDDSYVPTGGSYVPSTEFIPAPYSQWSNPHTPDVPSSETRPEAVKCTLCAQSISSLWGILDLYRGSLPRSLYQVLHNNLQMRPHLQRDAILQRMVGSYGDIIPAKFTISTHAGFLGGLRELNALCSTDIKGELYSKAPVLKVIYEFVCDLMGMAVVGVKYWLPPQHSRPYSQGEAFHNRVRARLFERYGQTAANELCRIVGDYGTSGLYQLPLDRRDRIVRGIADELVQVYDAEARRVFNGQGVPSQWILSSGY